MGHTKTTAAKATRATLGACVIALLLCAFSSPASAAPSHPPVPAQDLPNLNHACGVATDTKGDLYASSAGESKVKVYDPAHNLLTSIADTNQPCGLAVTTTGVLYVSEKATGEVVQFKPSAYPFSGTPTYGPREVIDASAKAKGIAVDPYDDGLYVAEGNRVSSYVNEFQTVTVENSTGGTFRLSFEGQKTPGGKEVGDVTSGSPTITSVLAASGTGTLTSGSTAVALQASAGEWVAGQSISGAGIPPGTTVTEVVSNTLTLSQAAEASGTGVALSAPGPLPFAVGETISGPGIPAGATIQSLGAGTITLSANATATTAAATLSTGLPYNATAAEVQGALAALPAIGAGNVEVTKPSSFLYSVFFVGKFAHTDVGTLSGNESGLTGPGPLRVRVSEKSRGRSAQIGEGVLGEASGVAAFTNFNALLDKSSSQAERFVWVADAGGLLKDRLYLFRSQNANVPTFDGRELDGATVPDGSFGFGTAGAYLAADPGNRNTAGECKVVGEQACTAGHLFLYDALHKALDEFDGSGEYLGQTKNAAFADAEPTAIAIERSGGTGDGTLYVTAGAAAGAKALAFGPLKAPSRAILGEPLSHKEVTRAQSVAVDSHGDVYVARAAASSSILIYGPSGVKITEITDQHKPRRVAVDSTGKVYVLDENKDGPASYEVTYYTPDKYPPDSTTTYTRRTEPIITPPKCGNLLIRTLAVNPGPGAGKDHLFVVCGENVLIYDSAAKGSGLIDKDFGKDLKAGVAVDSIAVDGATGTVYVGENRHVITGIDEVTKKFVVRFEDTGFSSGSFGSSPALAVDLSNGHVIEYDGVNKKAREYDRSGSFVAEFGTFTETAGIPYGIAVDNACVLHEPEPLSGKACEEYDPANGTAYVAFDDPSASNPPYDVSAFGGLGYPETGEPPLALTGIADEFGPGAATLNGTVDPKGSLLGECRFEYLTEAEYQTNAETFAGAEEESCAESPAEIGTGTKPVPVHADLESLAETPYRFRLVASNTGGSSEGEAVLFGPPQIEALSPLPILYHETNLRARVNPSGLASEYRFDFVDAQSFEEQGGFEGPATRHSAWSKLAAGEAAVQVSAAITGLEEGTQYRYRAVAKNDAATVEEPIQSFTTQVRRSAEFCSNGTYRFGLSANLPDCRAYELVTPAQTDGLNPYAADYGGAPSGSFSNWLTVQRDEGAGERLSYFTLGTLPGFEGNGLFDGYQAERGAGDHPAEGWQSVLFSPDYAESLPSLLSAPHQLGVASDQLYSSWEVNPDSEALPETLPHGVYLRTPEGFEALGQGSVEVEGETEVRTDLEALSRYVSADGKHAIFASEEHLEEKAAPQGTQSIYDREAGSSSAEVISVKPGGSAFGDGEGATYINANEAGSSVAFSVGGTLYLHREGITVEIAEAPNTFAGISEDGGRVFYAATTDGKSPAPLYACDVEAGPCAGLGAHLPTEIAAAGIFALVSPDGTHAFFSSEEALTEEEENDNHEHAEAGAHNLYAWDGGETHFIGQLSAGDFENDAFGIAGMNLAAWTTAVERSGRVYAPTRSTSAGDAFAFQSNATLTPYDNEGVGEIYRYDPSAEEGERLLCVSCNPSGAAPSADALFEDVRFGSSSPLTSSTMIANLTEDGQKVFFQSFDRLLPEDANDAEDVYGWTANGSGGCTRPGGCLALISSGQGETPSFLYAMSADGRDIFIHTKEKLVGMDEAGSPSIYDARVGGGIPESAVPAPCQGDACQGNGTEVPQIPSSATTGSGEEAEAPKAQPCAKGKHRVKGRCVKPHKKKQHAKKHHRRAKHDRRAGK